MKTTMKTTKLKVVALACLMIFGMSYCKNSPAEKAEDVEDAQEELSIAEDDLQKALIDSTNEYTRYKIESETKLKENDVKIADLKTKLKAEKLEIRTKYEKELSEIELKNSKLKTSIADYKETDENKWEKFKTNFNNELNEIGKSITKMTEQK